MHRYVFAWVCEFERHIKVLMQPPLCRRQQHKFNKPVCGAPWLSHVGGCAATSSLGRATHSPRHLWCHNATVKAIHSVRVLPLTRAKARHVHKIGKYEVIKRKILLLTAIECVYVRMSPCCWLNIGRSEHLCSQLEDSILENVVSCLNSYIHTVPLQRPKAPSKKPIQAYFINKL